MELGGRGGSLKIMLRVHPGIISYVIFSPPDPQQVGLRQPNQAWMYKIIASSMIIHQNMKLLLRASWIDYHVA